MSFQVDPAPQNNSLPAVTQWAYRMFTRAANLWNADVESVSFRILHAEPAKLRAGMEVYADGTDWNPGSGEGKYRRNVANNAWVFLG